MADSPAGGQPSVPIEFGALAAFFGDRQVWLSQREFDEAGLHALREALRHYGGPERWAREMGVVLAPDVPRSVARPRPAAVKSPRKWPLWDEPRITEELRVFLHGREEWPRHREFVEAGHKGLYQAVLVRGGTHVWARRMGVKWVKRHGGSPRRSRVTRKSKKSGSTRRLWDDERIETAIAPLVKELGRWPTKGEFRRAGLGGALSAVYDHGGSARWQKRLGVSPNPLTVRCPTAGGGRMSVLRASYASSARGVRLGRAGSSSTRAEPRRCITLPAHTAALHCGVSASVCSELLSPAQGSLQLGRAVCCERPDGVLASVRQGRT